MRDLAWQVETNMTKGPLDFELCSLCLFVRGVSAWLFGGHVAPLLSHDLCLTTFAVFLLACKHKHYFAFESCSVVKYLACQIQMNMMKCPLDFEICSLCLSIRMARSAFIGLFDVGLSVCVKTRFTTASVVFDFQGRGFDFVVLSVWVFVVVICCVVLFCFCEWLSPVVSALTFPCMFLVLAL